MLSPFDLARPRSLSEALGLLDDHSSVYCGGTELLMAMKFGLLEPRLLVDLKRVDELTGIRAGDRELVVGAATTHRELARHAEVARRLPLLRQVELRVGNARVRAQGSIGGNLCFAEPRSDVTTICVALGARVALASSGGVRRELAVSDFLRGGYETAIEPGELLVEVVLPGLDTVRGVHIKQQYSERPIVSVIAVHGRPDGSCALAVGAVGEIPYLAVAGSLSEFDPADVAAAVDPTDDLLGSAEYKRALTEVLVTRALDAARSEEAA